MDSNEKLISSIVESVMKQLQDQIDPELRGSNKMICEICANEIRSGNVYTGRKNQWKWSIVDNKPVHGIWENCHKCKSYELGPRFKAKVKHDV